MTISEAEKSELLSLRKVAELSQERGAQTRRALGLSIFCDHAQVIQAITQKRIASELSSHSAGYSRAMEDIRAILGLNPIDNICDKLRELRDCERRLNAVKAAMS